MAVSAQAHLLYRIRRKLSSSFFSFFHKFFLYLWSNLQRKARASPPGPKALFRQQEAVVHRPLRHRVLPPDLQPLQLADVLRRQLVRANLDLPDPVVEAPVQPDVPELDLAGFLQLLSQVGGYRLLPAIDVQVEQILLLRVDLREQGQRGNREASSGVPVFGLLLSGFPSDCQTGRNGDLLQRDVGGQKHVYAHTAPPPQYGRKAIFMSTLPSMPGTLPLSVYCQMR